MERREFLSIAAIAAIASAGCATGRASAQNASDAEVTRIIGLFATEDGESYFEDVDVAHGVAPLPVKSVLFGYLGQGTEDWHTVPAGQFSINITGDIEVETSTGQKRAIGPGDLVFVGDTHGKGHVTRLITPVSNLFIRMQDGFDVHAWASGQA